MLKFFYPNYAQIPWQMITKIGSELAQFVNMWAEWAHTMEDGVPCSSFPAQILLIWADNSAQNQHSVLPGSTKYFWRFAKC